MRTNATSSFSLYLFVVLLMVLVSNSNKVDAKRGCAAFGHSCFGGHGKRFDPVARRNTLQASNNPPNRNSQESEISPPNNDLLFVFPSDKHPGRSERLFMPSRRDSQQFDPYPLSSLVNQWLATHRRPHRTDLEITNK